MESPRQGRLLAEAAACEEELTQRQVFRQDLWLHGGTTPEQSVPERLYSVEWTPGGTILEVHQPMGLTHIGAIGERLDPTGEGLYPRGGTPCCSKERA